MKDEEKSKDQLINELVKNRQRLLEWELTEVRRREAIKSHPIEDRFIWMPTAGLFALLIIVVTLNEFLDLPHLLMGGEETPVNIAEVVIEIAEMTVVGLMIILKLIHDIRQRRPREEELKSVYEITHLSKHAIAITNSENVITYVNPTLVKLFGYKDRMELIGKGFAHLFVPDDPEHLQQSHWHIPETIDEPVDVIAQDNKGTGFPVKLMTSTSLNSQKKIAGRIYFIVDMTEQHLKDGLLWNVKDEFKKIFPDSVG